MCIRDRYIEARLSGHVMIEADHIEVFSLQPLEPGPARQRELDLETARLQRLLHQSRQAQVVVDVQDSGVRLRHWVSGTCITAKNSPSWRMALAKLS